MLLLWKARFMKKLFFFVCLIAASLVSKAQIFPYCKPGLFSEQTYYSDISITHDLNVIYGSNLTFQGNLIDLALDIHYPNLLIDPLPLRPTIILLHGGGFVSGSKGDMTNYCVKLARAGYVAVSVDYRLGWDAIGGGGSCNGNIPQLKYAMYRAIQDVNASIRFLVEKASDYRIDTSNIFLVGQSEGGMTAMHCAFMDQVEADNLLAGASADLGKIDSASNTIFNTYHLKGIVNWCGAALDTNMIGNDQAIPLLSIHGLLDSIMPVEFGTYFNCQNANNPYPNLYGPKSIYKRMKNKGICTEANFDASGSHCFFPSLEETVYIPAKFTCFIKNLLCGNCTTESKVSYNQKSCVESAPVRTAEIWKPINLQIFPNPVENNIQISALLNSSESISIEMFDMTGKAVATLFVGRAGAGDFKKSFAIPDGISKGMYFLKISVEEKQINKRILIQ